MIENLKPENVLIGLFLAVCAAIIGRIASEQVEKYNARKIARFEHAKRKQKENDYE